MMQIWIKHGHVVAPNFFNIMEFYKEFIGNDFMVIFL